MLRVAADGPDRHRDARHVSANLHPTTSGLSGDHVAHPEGEGMAPPRPSQRDMAAARKAARQEDMDRAIAEGRLVVRKMTAEERAQSDARVAAAEVRAGRRPRRGR